jgi:hypothetical protein
MNRLDIDKAQCKHCSKPIHLYHQDGEWSHDTYADYLMCRHVAEPKTKEESIE